MRTPSPQRLAVLGSPIAHSKSPRLHEAAARALGVERQYSAVELREHELAGFLASREPGWRGCSLTMPLKSVAVPMCRTVSPVAQRADAVNTIVFDGPEPDAPFDGFNTDVEGVRRALDEAGAGTARVELLGAGSTASSVLLACAERGATELVIRARAPERARDAERLAASLGMSVRVVHLDDDPARTGDGMDDVDLVINTIPGGDRLRVRYPKPVRRTATLFDVIYDPWPTSLAAHWLDAGGQVVSGLDMLLYQAIAQVRLFTRPEDGARAVTDAELLAAMRAALGR
ncbi:shikimate 5-dehydrogenase [Pseudoclavibacter endophyticus]|uniref:Shikimate dehydrogenase n=1 Tax=Pseudoclavibacter endophyticus TaxID=1778590 RepID=A0A6H9WPM5_9MICO|nr:shikimate dehydrogenase [Pseudoclavibacter endophyticus]KAB1650078.1 shikimate dehydrogenase [Pseudoclavibacter endophyticus]GGA57469.1 shikimate 5-dehydrogenase [Pseudoclavibacter endophyticus]